MCLLYMNVTVCLFSFSFYSEEDLHARYAQMMLKYFSAEGIMSGHALFVASADQDPHQIIQVCTAAQTFI